MNQQRRKFLKRAGLAGLGAVAGIIPTFALEKTDPSVFSDRPVPGATRWGMLIDTRKCRDGCDECVAACHRTHNVPDFGDSKNEIKWIWKAPYEKAFPTSSRQFGSRNLDGLEVLTLCNHCAEPPCTKACPTKATFKRWDGIVAMDYHRCIGCRFCMAACPYGSRSFNWLDPRPAIETFSPDYPTRERGVVEKCNFCSERLVKGLQPACVEACRGNAIIFGDLNDPESAIRTMLAENETVQRKPELGTLPSVFYII